MNNIEACIMEVKKTSISLSIELQRQEAAGKITLRQARAISAMVSLGRYEDALNEIPEITHYEVAEQKGALKCWVDGGCLNNGGTEPTGYGSFLIEGHIAERLHFVGLATTNNQAEYLALDALLQELQRMGVQGNVTVFTDSQLMQGQIRKEKPFKVNDEKLRELRNIVQSRIESFGLDFSLNLVWVPREQIVAKLGH